MSTVEIDTADQKDIDQKDVDQKDDSPPAAALSSSQDASSSPITPNQAIDEKHMLESQTTTDLENSDTPLTWQEVFTPLPSFMRMCFILPLTSSKCFGYFAKCWLFASSLVFCVPILVLIFLNGGALRMDPFLILQTFASTLLLLIAPMGAWVLQRYLARDDFSQLMTPFLSSLTPAQLQSHQSWFRAHFYLLLFIVLPLFTSEYLTIHFYLRSEVANSSYLFTSVAIFVNSNFWSVILLLILIYRVLYTRLSDHLELVTRREFSTPDHLLDAHYALVEYVQSTFEPLRAYIAYIITVLVLFTISFSLLLYRASFQSLQSAEVTWMNALGVLGYYYVPSLLVMVYIARINSINGDVMRMIDELHLFDWHDRSALKSDLQNFPIVVTIYGDHPISRGMPVLTFSALVKAIASVFVSLLPVFTKIILDSQNG